MVTLTEAEDDPDDFSDDSDSVSSGQEFFAPANTEDFVIEDEMHEVLSSRIQAIPVTSLRELTFTSVMDFIGWAAVSESLTSLINARTGNLVQLFAGLNAISFKTEQKITLLVHHDDLRKNWKNLLEWEPFPEVAFLIARLMPWNPDDPQLLGHLYHARFFHQAMPYLVRILGDPDSRLFEPFTLVRLAKERLRARYPAFRHYRITDVPPWPENDYDPVISDMVTLLDLPAKSNRSAARTIKRDFLQRLEQGQFHAGLCALLLELDYFDQGEKERINQQINQHFYGYAGARWVQSYLRQMPDRELVSLISLSSSEQGHLFFYTDLILRLWHVDLNQALKYLRHALQQSRQYLTGHMKEPQLFHMAHRLYLDPEWPVTHAREPHGSVYLGSAMQELGFAIDMITEINKELLITSTFVNDPEIIKKRLELEKHFLPTTTAQQVRKKQSEILLGYMAKLANAWQLTRENSYLKTLKSLESKFTKEKEAFQLAMKKIRAFQTGPDQAARP